MDGGKIKVDTSTYQNDMVTFTGKDDVLSLLIHLGYLGFDDETSEVFVPNKEILDEFKTSTKSSEWLSTFESFELSQKLIKATWEMNSDKVAELLEKAHDVRFIESFGSTRSVNVGAAAAIAMYEYTRQIIF